MIGPVFLVVRSALVAFACLIVCLPSAATAAIFRWDNGEVIPGTEGITVGPGMIVDGLELSFADLAGASLVGASFEGTNLSDARLHSSNLTNAEFTDAEISGASFRATTALGFTKEQLYSTLSYLFTSMPGVNLADNNLSGWDFSGQDMTGASFQNSNLSGAIISGAILNQTGLTAAQLESTADYAMKNLDGIDLGGNNLSGADLSGQSLFFTSFAGSTLTGVDFTDAEIEETLFADTTTRGFTKEQLYSTANYKRMDLSGTRLGNNALAGWNFSGQRFEFADLSESDATLANFANADLRLANLDSSTLVQANFSNADLRDASFADTMVADANFTGAIVNGTIFSGSDLSKEQLYTTASYQQKNLQDIVLFGNDLTGWNFSGQDLTGANLGATTLTGANLTGAVIADAFLGSVDGLTKEQFYSTASYQQHNLRDIDLSGNDLTAWDFSGQDLSGVGFEGATLRDANLAGAMIQGTRFDSTVMRGFTKEQLYSTASYQQKNLQRIRFRSNNLDGWNFRGQDLRGADFSSTSLASTDFSLADLRGARAFDPDQTTVIRNIIDPDSILITLNLLPGETLVANAGGFLGLPVAFFGQFSIDPAAKLDLTDNAAIVYQAPASVVREQLIAGRGGPGLGRGWNGNGITSSTAAAANQSSPESRSIGYALNGSLPLGPYMEFHEFPVEASSVLLAYTRTGDATLDGVVDDDDVTIVGAAYAPGVSQPHWALGDFDYNGFVDDDDVTLLGVFYDPTAAPLAAPPVDSHSVAAVPEPPAIALAALVALTATIGVVMRRRRIRRNAMLC
jgi:uncharacterized protein YjbI with pentapeptide repeats